MKKTTTPLCVRLLCLFCGFGIWEQLETYILIVIFVSLKNENQFPFVPRLQGQWIDRHRALKSLILQLLSSVSIVESLKVSSATWICHPKIESKIFHCVGVWSVSFMILWWSVIMRLIMIHIFYHTSWSFWAHVCYSGAPWCDYQKNGVWVVKICHFRGWEMMIFSSCCWTFIGFFHKIKWS